MSDQELNELLTRIFREAASQGPPSALSMDPPPTAGALPIPTATADSEASFSTRQVFLQPASEGTSTGSPVPASGTSSPSTPLEDAMRSLAGRFSTLEAAQNLLSEAVSGNTAAVDQNTVAQGQSKAGSAVATLGKSVASIFTSGLGISPLIKSVVGLFRSDQTPTEEPLVRYEAPSPVKIEAATLSGSGSLFPVGFAPLSYGQHGLPQMAEGAYRDNGASAATGSYSPQVTVNVSAMDSRSFLDHSDDIARAVRDAMLNMHSLNDVVTDL